MATLSHGPIARDAKAAILLKLFIKVTRKGHKQLIHRKILSSIALLLIGIGL
jgi:hypothetical protein